MRRRLMILAALMTSGCNVVLSERPWFAQSDTSGAPLIRDGLWALLDDATCAFDERKPADRWPACATPIVVRGNELLEPAWLTKGTGRKAKKEFQVWQVSTMFIAIGNPLILQNRAEGERMGQIIHSYLGIRPTSVDDQGRIVALTMLPVQCGPLPSATESGEAGESSEAGEYREQHVTRKPFPGLTVADNNCTAESADALRNAARLSEQLAPSEGKFAQPAHWVREGWP